MLLPEEAREVTQFIEQVMAEVAATAPHPRERGQNCDGSKDYDACFAEIQERLSRLEEKPWKHRDCLIEIYAKIDASGG